MGREIKRVPLDFNAPLNKVWQGYINPYGNTSEECQYCGGTGMSVKANYLHAQWYGQAFFKPEDRGSVPFKTDHPIIQALASKNVGAPKFMGNDIVEPWVIQQEAQRLCDLFNARWMHHINADDIAALIRADRLYDFTHVWIKGKGWIKKSPTYIPTPKEVNEWSLCGMGHDSLNAWAVIKAECKRKGYETECPHCKGEGTLWPDAEDKANYDNWKQVEPPSGVGYQLWETVSEGSPISPVFEKPEDLAKWLVESPDYQWRDNDAGTTYAQWLKFIKSDGWAPSMVLADGKLQSGVEAMTNES